MNCPNCQTEVPEGSAFCHNCGAPIPASAPPVAPRPPALRRAWPLAAGAGALAAVAAVVVVVLVVVQPFGGDDGDDLTRGKAATILEEYFAGIPRMRAGGLCTLPSIGRQLIGHEWIFYGPATAVEIRATMDRLASEGLLSYGEVAPLPFRQNDLGVEVQLTDAGREVFNEDPFNVSFVACIPELREVTGIRMNGDGTLALVDYTWAPRLTTLFSALEPVLQDPDLGIEERKREIQTATCTDFAPLALFDDGWRVDESFVIECERIEDGQASEPVTDTSTPTPTLTPTLPSPVADDDPSWGPEDGAEVTVMPRTPGECGETFIVKAGDVSFSIAQQCGVEPDDVADWVNDMLDLNGINDPTTFRVGQELKIPQ